MARGGTRWHEVPSPVFFPSFDLLLYYNTHAALAHTLANTRHPRAHPSEHETPSRTHTRIHAHPHTHTHPRGRTGRERISNMRPAKGKQGGSTHLFSNLFQPYKSGVWGDLPLALADFFGPSVKLSLALSKGLCHKQPIETQTEKRL